MSGWVKLHRSLLDWEWYNDCNVVYTFIHLLLEANWEDKKWRGMIIPRGSLVTSVAKLAESLKLTIQQTRTVLSKLKLTNNITITATNGYCNGFNIENWLMQQDGGAEFKNLKFLLPDYCALVRFVCDERLPEKIGYSEWEKLNHKERMGESGIKFKTAWENGLFTDREDILPLICQRRHGKDVFISLLPVEQRMNNGEFEF